MGYYKHNDRTPTLQNPQRARAGHRPRLATTYAAVLEHRLTR